MEILNLSAYDQPVPPAYEGAYEGADGRREWYFEGKLHRLDGPAYEGAGGSKSWYFEGKLHRVDGPAWEGADGTKAWGLFSYSLTNKTSILLVL